MGIKINDLTAAASIKASDVLPISQDDGAGGRNTLKVNMQQVAAYAASGVSGGITSVGIISDGSLEITGSPLVANGNIHVALSSVGLDKISNAGATDGDVIKYNGSTSTWVARSSESGFRNRIINGDMRIDQRNAGASETPTNNSYSADRWSHNVTAASKFTTQQVSGTPPTGFVNYLRVTSSSSYTVGTTDIFSIRQFIEGYNVADFGWGAAGAASVTLSFWVRSSLTGTFGGCVRNSAGDRSYMFSYAIAAANTWEQKSIVITGDTTGTWLKDSSIGLNVSFSIGTGSTYSGTAGSWTAGTYTSVTGATSVVGTSGATFDITGVQLEKGTTATPFEFRPIGTELALCQRYYEKSYEVATKPGTATSYGAELKRFTYVDSTFGDYYTVTFKQEKRTRASMVYYAPVTGNVNKWSDVSTVGLPDITVVDMPDYIGTRTAIANIRFVPLANCGVSGHWTATAEL